MSTLSAGVISEYGKVEEHDPTACDTEYCQWDEAFRQYVYTNAWVDRLSEELVDAGRFEAAVGKPPMLA